MQVQLVPPAHGGPALSATVSAVAKQAQQNGPSGGPPAPGCALPPAPPPSPAIMSRSSSPPCPGNAGGSPSTVSVAAKTDEPAGGLMSGSSNGAVPLTSPAPSTEVPCGMPATAHLQLTVGTANSTSQHEGDASMQSRAPALAASEPIPQCGHSGDVSNLAAAVPRSDSGSSAGSLAACRALPSEEQAEHAHSNGALEGGHANEHKGAHHQADGAMIGPPNRAASPLAAVTRPAVQASPIATACNSSPVQPNRAACCSQEVEPGCTLANGPPGGRGLSRGPGAAAPAPGRGLMGPQQHPLQKLRLPARVRDEGKAREALAAAFKALEGHSPTARADWH